MNKLGRNAQAKTWLALALAAVAFGPAAAGCDGAGEAADASAEPELGESAAAIDGSAIVVPDFRCVDAGEGPKPCSTAKCMGFFDGGWEYWWDSSSCGSTRTLTVEKVVGQYVGTGQGTVTSSPAGINCGPSCTGATKAYAPGTSVTLTATAAPHNVFIGWQGVCPDYSPTCTVTMDQARTVRAVFELKRFLTVEKGGAGTGRVLDVSFPGSGIDCGSACSLEYWIYTPVTLCAYADPGSHFTGWSGGCSGTSICCTVTTDVAKTVTANFGGVAIRCAPGREAAWGR